MAKPKNDIADQIAMFAPDETPAISPDNAPPIDDEAIVDGRTTHADGMAFAAATGEMSAPPAVHVAVQSVTETAPPPGVAEPGPMMLVELGSLTIAADNCWGSDVVDSAHFRRLFAVAANPEALEAMLVVRAENGWSVVGDPLALVALERRHRDDPDRAALMVPVREIVGGREAVVYHVARAALGGRPFRGMRRARLALQLKEVDGEQGRSIAARLGLHASGTTRDLQAARIERQHPDLAAILARPSEAPVSYFTDIREHADDQASPVKAMAAMVATAAKLARSDRRFTPKAAKAALGVAATGGTDTMDLGDVGTGRSATCATTAAGGLRVVLTVDRPAGARDPAAAVARWLAAAGPIGD